MNVQDIITRVRRTFGDEAAVQVTDDDVIRWINDAQIEIVKQKEEALQTTSYLNLVAGTSQYTLPTDLLLLHTLRYKTNTMLSYTLLRFKSMQQFDEEMDGWDGTQYGQGSPVYFTLSEGKAILFPTPDTSATNGIKVLYSKQPVTVDDPTDTLSLPLIYHNTVVKYCMWQASLLDEDHEPGLMYQNNFNEDVDKMRTKETQDPVATYPIITILSDDL